MDADLYSNLLRATDNTQDITTEKYGTITKLENNLCSVKEEESDLEHANVPILNGITVKTGDKVVLGFINNDLYNPVVYGVIGRKIDSGSDDYILDELSVDWSDIENKPSSFNPSSHSHGQITNDGKITQTGTNGGNLVVTNTNNAVVVESVIDVMDGLIQSLINYGGS